MKIKYTFFATIVILLFVLVTYEAGLPAERDAAYGNSEHSIASNGYNLFDFSDSGIVGSTNYYNDTIDFEGYYGIKAKCSGSKVTVTTYSHCPKEYSKGTLNIKHIKSGKSVELGDIKINQRITVDMKDIARKMGIKGNSAYYLVLVPNDKETINMMLWYEDGYVYTAHYNYDTASDIEDWNNLTKDIDPNKCLEMWVGRKNNPITYPTSGQNGSCNHVQLWCDLSDEIIKDDNWSDEFKTYLIVEYLIMNYAYDDWRVDKNNNVSRATKYSAFNIDENFMYYNKVGNCWDFANASTIMLRHQGIPATSVENSRHGITAVYLNDKWYGIDISSMTQYHSPLEDYSKDNWVKRREEKYRDLFGYHDRTMKTYNQTLSTPEIMSTSGSGANPR